MKDKNKRERWEGKKREIEIWNIMTERCVRNGKDGGLTEGKTCKAWVHVKGKGGRQYCFLEGFDTWRRLKDNFGLCFYLYLWSSGH